MIPPDIRGDRSEDDITYKVNTKVSKELPNPSRSPSPPKCTDYKKFSFKSTSEARCEYTLPSSKQPENLVTGSLLLGFII